MKRTGPRTEPWGTPRLMRKERLWEPPTWTLALRSERKERTQRTKQGGVSTLAIHIKRQNLNVVLFFKKSPIKSECLMIIICKEISLKACGSLRSGDATTRVNPKIDHVDNQIILKLPNVQIFS